jgi:hypothetical protein
MSTRKREWEMREECSLKIVVVHIPFTLHVNKKEREMREEEWKSVPCVR